jgi:hypothetical protein
LLHFGRLSKKHAHMYDIFVYCVCCLPSSDSQNDSLDTLRGWQRIFMYVGWNPIKDARFSHCIQFAVFYRFSIGLRNAESWKSAILIMSHRLWINNAIASIDNSHWLLYTFCCIHIDETWNIDPDTLSLWNWPRPNSSYCRDENMFTHVIAQLEYSNR